MESNLQPSELRDIFRINMRNRRTEIGMTQVVLAEKLGVSQAFITKLELGTKAPSLEMVASIASNLRTTPNALLTQGIFEKVS